MATAECPVGECGYTGPVKSVEAHLTGSASGDHAGKLGRNFREDLIGQVEGKLNGGDEGGVTPLGLSRTEWVVVALATLAILWWLAKDSGGSEGGSEGQAPDDPDEQDEEGEEEGGLI